MSTMIEDIKDVLVNEMNDTLEKEVALFIPSDDTTTAHKPKYRAKTAGEYLGHITKVRTEVKEWEDEKTGDNYSACIYNFKVLVAPENSSMTYTTTHRDGHQETYNGEDYVDWPILANGVFRFLEPNKDGTDTFVSNASGNDSYLRFCQAIGVSIETTPREVNGKTVDVSVIPILEEKDITGIPVTAVVGRHKDDWVNKEGITVPHYRVKFIKAWTDGKRLVTDVLPF